MGLAVVNHINVSNFGNFVASKSVLLSIQCTLRCTVYTYNDHPVFVRHLAYSSYSFARLKCIAVFHMSSLI